MRQHCTNNSILLSFIYILSLDSGCEFCEFCEFCELVNCDCDSVNLSKFIKELAK
jgi:hypothetical protein